MLYLRSMARLRENWEKLPKNRKGEVKKKTGDYSVRLGQCQPPVSLQELFVYTVTHKVCVLYN